MNRLLVNADDFGLHPDINRGVLEAADAGRLQSVSVCANGAAPDWEALRSRAARGLRVGVHLALVGEPWATSDVQMPGWAALLPRLAFAPRVRHLVETECRRQIETVRDQGLPIAHLDSHQHVHVLPRLWSLVLQLASEYDIPRVRLPAVPRLSLVRRSAGGLALQVLAAARSRAAGRTALPCLGIAHSGHNTLARIEAELAAAAGQDVELVLHPGVTTAALRERYGAWDYDWSAERALLLDPEWPATIARHGFQPFEPPEAGEAP